jgi:hypothetical protein
MYLWFWVASKYLVQLAVSLFVPSSSLTHQNSSDNSSDGIVGTPDANGFLVQTSMKLDLWSKYVNMHKHTKNSIAPGKLFVPC